MTTLSATWSSARHWPIFTQQLMWTAGCFGLTVLPHVGGVRSWLTLLALATVAWRLTIAVRQWRLPYKWMRIGIAFGAMFGVLATYRTLNGLEAGTAFLIVMGAMKLLESQTKRDLTIVLFASYFLLFAGFLYNQQILLLPYMLIATWLLTATLMRIHQSAPVSAMSALESTGRMFLIALPLAAVLFLLFPRLPGQFWSVPARETARTGLDDELSPGDVSDLSLSGAVAFRVRFEDERVPPARELYWRGPVLHDFDGRVWRRQLHMYSDTPVEAVEASYRYRLTLEPHNRNWVFALDAVTHWPSGTRRAADFQLVSYRRISALRSFDLESATSYRTNQILPDTIRANDLRLPPNRNPRATELARRIRSQVDSDEAFVDAVLKRFREQDYFYTLEPPRLESDSVDDFLFNTRRGFCEHFASAFTMMARAAGIPARIVTGYQGGDFNPLNGYLVVRQSDAHAWSEVWLEAQGWVRVDPTGAVAPERVERGIDAAISDDEAVPGRLFVRNTLLTQFRNAWDALNTYWNDNVVQFGQVQQLSLLRLLGIEDADWRQLGVGIGTALIAFFAILSAHLALKYRPPRRDVLVETYEHLCKRLARQNLPRASYEGPRDYFARVAAARPELGAQLDQVLRVYLSLRYGPAPLRTEISRLKFLINQLKI